MRLWDVATCFDDKWVQHYLDMGYEPFAVVGALAAEADVVYLRRDRTLACNQQTIREEERATQEGNTEAGE